MREKEKKRDEREEKWSEIMGTVFQFLVLGVVETMERKERKKREKERIVASFVF